MSLRQRLLEEIRRDGPMTFAAFMDRALYDPEEGFYTRPPVGRDGHFVTSPHVSPAFGDLLGRQVAQCWDLLGRPASFTVVEAGAGDGTLARQILRAVAAVPELAGSLHYVGVERTEGARRALGEHGVEVREEIPTGFTGVVIANELLDNLPFHRLRERDGRTVEVYVGAEGDRLVETEADPSPAALAALDRPLRPGEERPVSPDALRLIEVLAASIARGYAFFIDYGFTGDEHAAPAHAYREHGRTDDLLSDPGSRDLTVAVDLDAIAAAARGAGLEVWGPVSQREALLALGYRMWSSGVRARQAEVEAQGHGREATLLADQRTRAGLLLEEGGLGSLRVLVMATEGLEPPAVALGDRDRGC